jgi:uncharacterized membrane protein YdjX (TVP38/TMEM64 family)
MEKASKRWLLILVSGIFLVSGVVFLIWGYDPSGWLDYILNEKTHPFLFVVLMALLPGFGFPISVFLVTAGAKFGLAGGLFLSLLTIPIHLSISYLIGNSMFRGRLQKYLSEKSYQLPEIPKEKMVPWSLVFVAIPSMPYAVKNYLLALADLPPVYYFAINWPINLMLSVPFLGLGESAARMNLWLFFLFILILAAGYGFALWLKKRFNQISN